MAVNLYDTFTLNGFISTMRRVPNRFLDQYFPDMLQHNSEEVYIDRATERPRITPFVHPLEGGKIIASKGFTTDSVRPAYLKDLRKHYPLKAIKRRPGESIGGNFTQEQREQLNLIDDLAEQQRMIYRRMELMAAEALIKGKCTIVGNGFNSLIDFGRDPSLTVALAGTDPTATACRWDHTDSTGAGDAPIVDQFEAWIQTINDLYGEVNEIYMDQGAYKLLRRNKNWDKLLNRFRRGADNTTLNQAPQSFIDGVERLVGELDQGLPVYMYNASYIDPESNTALKLMPANTVLLVGKKVQGVRHFGAIQNYQSMMAQEQFASSWLENNPSARMLQLESAPLMVPYFPNSSMSITVA